jgi:hypothetical protein
VVFILFYFSEIYITAAVVNLCVCMCMCACVALEF